MTKLPYPVYDADNHYYETADAFLRYLPKQYRNEFQYVQVRGRTKLAVAGQITNYIPNPTVEVVAAPGSHEKWYRAQNPDGLSLKDLQGPPIESPESFRSSTDRLKLMDEQGLHASVFFPTLASEGSASSATAFSGSSRAASLRSRISVIRVSEAVSSGSSMRIRGPTVLGSKLMFIPFHASVGRPA